MVLANLRPEYQNKVHLANFLAPVAYVEHMKSPIRYLAPFIGSVEVSDNYMIYFFISKKKKTLNFSFWRKMSNYFSLQKKRKENSL